MDGKNASGSTLPTATRIGTNDIRSGLANNDDQRTSSPTTLAAFLQGLYSITCTFKTGAFGQAFGSNQQDEINDFPLTQLYQFAVFGDDFAVRTRINASRINGARR